MVFANTFQNNEARGDNVPRTQFQPKIQGIGRYTGLKTELFSTEIELIIFALWNWRLGLIGGISFFR